jgi:hypothetical protein
MRTTERQAPLAVGRQSLLQTLSRYRPNERAGSSSSSDYWRRRWTGGTSPLDGRPGMSTERWYAFQESPAGGTRSRKRQYAGFDLGFRGN